MSPRLDRRDLLKKMVCGSVAVGAAGIPHLRVPVFAQGGRGGSAAALVSSLDRYLTKLGSVPRSSEASKSNGADPAPAPAPVRDLPLFGGAATQPLPPYTNLVLKSISGSSTRRFALINSETMAPGEWAWFKLGDGRVKVHCVEVSEKSARVRVEGDPAPRELLLSDFRR